MQRSTTFVEVDVTKKKSDSLEEAISVREPLAVPRGEAGDAGSIPETECHVNPETPRLDREFHEWRMDDKPQPAVASLSTLQPPEGGAVPSCTPVRSYEELASTPGDERDMSPWRRRWLPDSD